MKSKLACSVGLALSISTTAMAAEPSRWETPTMINGRAAMLMRSLSKRLLPVIDSSYTLNSLRTRSMTLWRGADRKIRTIRS